MKNVLPMILALTTIALNACSNPPETKPTETADTTKPTIASFAQNTGSTVLEINASDTGGITKVEFWRGANLAAQASTGSDELLETDTTAPYAYTFKASDNGSRNYYAKVFDGAGNISTSQTVNVTVNIVVNDTTPPAIASFTSNSTMLELAATDAVGITKVEFWRSGNLAPESLRAQLAAPRDTLLETDTTAPYTYSFNIADNGTFGYYAKVFDAAGNSSTSATVNATVNIADTTAPSKPTMTLNKTSLSSGEVLTATAGNVLDNIGVSKVELVLVGSSANIVLQADTNAPYEFSETVICTGGSPELAAQAAPAANTQSKTFKLIASDAAGNSAESDSQTVTVNCGPSK